MLNLLHPLPELSQGHPTATEEHEALTPTVFDGGKPRRVSPGV